MDTGTKISALGHAGLITWVVIGGLFHGTDRAPPLPAVAEVSLISAEEFAALAPPRATAPPAPAARPEPAPAPEIAALPEPDPEPAPELQREPDPETVVIPPAPEPAPEPAPAPVVTAPPPPEPQMPPAPTVSPVPLPRPAERVAPEPVEAPPPDTEIAAAPREAVAPDPEPSAEAERPPEPAAAPEAATTQIITEATRTDERGGGAPLTSPRPQARPDRPRPEPPQPEQVAAAQPARPDPPRPDPPRAEPARPAPPASGPQDDQLASIADAVAAAVAAEVAQAGVLRPDAPATGALTSGEMNALRMAVQGCWNVGALSTEALAVTVTLAFSLGRDARPTGDMRLIDWSGGSEAAARQAYEAARRAILICGRDGFPLPDDKFEVWRDVEMTFNPESMRIR